jgi:hypothetical protein
VISPYFIAARVAQRAVHDVQCTYFVLLGNEKFKPLKTKGNSVRVRATFRATAFAYIPLKHGKAGAI